MDILQSVILSQTGRTAIWIEIVTTIMIIIVVIITIIIIVIIRKEK